MAQNALTINERLSVAAALIHGRDDKIFDKQKVQENGPYDRNQIMESLEIDLERMTERQREKYYILVGCMQEKAHSVETMQYEVYTAESDHALDGIES